jgi:hypothetical protein
MDAMHERERDDLLAVNDAVLRPLIVCSSDEERRVQIETLLTRHVLPVVQRVIGQRQSSNGLLRPQDAEDIASSVTVRLVRKLQRVPFEREEAIERLAEFAASSTLNAIHDFMRHHFPARARLKDRVRYALTHDERFRTWSVPAGTACALTCWPDARLTGPLPSSFHHGDATQPGDAIDSLLRDTQHPLLLDDIVQALADAWGVVEERAVAGTEIADDTLSHEARLETRRRLEALWRETRALPAQQRSALLLNLRDADGNNAIALFALLGIASFEEVAAAMDLPAQQLATLWPRLPLDDLTIASLLGVRRQQVINLRLAARQRLSRRMKKWEA